MGILAWIILGALAAWLERQLLRRTPPSSFLGSMILAFAGAVLGSLLAYSFGFGDFTGFNARSILITATGIVIILVVYRTLESLVARRRPVPPDVPPG